MAHMDHRDLAYISLRNYIVGIDERRMEALIRADMVVETLDEGEMVEAETIRVPIKFDVCPTCNGKGTFVNPDIDRQGLTREDFDMDPSFKEDYFNGLYDVTCTHCGGKRVIPVPNVDRLTAEHKQLLAAIDRHMQEEAEYARTCYMERLLGC